MQNSHINLSLAASNKNILEPPAEFEKKVRKVTWALIAFIIVYLVFTIAGLIIALGMVGFGVFLLANIQMFIVLIFGVGLILSGAMLVFFLVKSIFIKAPAKANRYEVTETEQPELFDFIRQLTVESGAPFPKHIYLAPDVNASVFFDSSFWSMLFPIRKNLVIGIALVNCINQSEFRAIMAHEFGHFSQRSMRFGSYVYNFNRVVHNTLYENKSYDKMLRAWARWHYILRLTAKLNIKIINIIQDTLRKMYVYVNKAHLELSREMEFHADAIAAYYGGANNMSLALRRLDAGDECYNKVLDILTQKMKDGYRSNNVYPPHLYILRHFAGENQLTTDDNGLPIIKKNMAVLNNRRVDVKNPWSSHPTMPEREAKLQEIGIITQPVEKPASLLFRNIATIQEHLTAQMYQNVNADYTQLKVMDADEFKKEFEEQFESSSYNTGYKGFYNNRLLTEFDVNEAVLSAKSTSQTTFDALFTEENCNLPKAIAGMKNDIATLTNIAEGNNVDIINFDFEGTNYSKDNAGDIKGIINAQLEAAEEKIALLDKEIYVYFYQLAGKRGLEQSLQDQYKQALNYQELAKPDYENYNDLMNDLSPVYGRMQPGAIYETINHVHNREKTVKPRIKEVLTDPSLMPYLTDIKKEAIESYLSKTWDYYVEPSYDNNAISILNSGLNAYVSIISERNFQYKKSLFDFQLSLLNS